MLTVGGLFSGIGGIELGLQRAGMQIKWMVEIDPFCQKVLAKHWPDVERYADVKDCGKHNLAAVDLIAGGFPCQPHSVAGKQRGAEDDRDLWPEYRRIVAELRPTWILAENVPGIRRTMLDEVLSDLDGLAYSTRTIIVPACALDAPHIRERVFIVAHAKDYRSRWREPQSESCQGTGNVAHAARQRWDEKQTPDGNGNREPSGQARGCGSNGIINPWLSEPDVGRVVNGVSYGVDRLRALGNAVVPQVVEWIGQRIVEVAQSHPTQG